MYFPLIEVKWLTFFWGKFGVEVRGWACSDEKMSTVLNWGP